MADGYLTTLAAQLSAAGGASAPPMHLRVGGSASNGLVYLPSGAPGRGPHGETVLTDASLAALNAFAARANAQVTLCLPYQTRGGAFDPSINATALLSRVAAAGHTSITGFSLGNEIIGGAGFDVAQYARDYVVFRGVVATAGPPWAQRVVGPSAAGFPGATVIDPFLTGTRGIANMSVSIHAYAFKNCTLATYVDKAGMERMSFYYQVFVAARDAFAPALPVYLEEMATQAGGGCDGLSNRFVSGFWFIHALGLAAEARVSRVTRQDLAGWSFTSGKSMYTLAGPPGWASSASDGPPTPHPDYYVALLWRQLVGPRVLSAALGASPGVNATTAVHAFCAAPGAGAPPGAGAVVLAFFNSAGAALELALGPGTPPAPRVEFVLTPPAGGGLTSDAALLNGAPLGVDAAGRLPAQPVPGRAVAEGALELPPQSLGFVVLSAAAAPACVAAA